MTRTYDSLAAYYDRWIEGDPAAGPCAAFYRRLYRETGGLIVELGVGNGRIAGPAAREGAEIVGVDSSTAMLRAACAAWSACTGEGLHLIAADMRALPLRSGTASLIALPFRTIGHFTDNEEKRQVLLEAKRLLSQRGIFVVDHYVFDREWANAHNGRWRKMYVGHDRLDGVLGIYDRYDYDFENCIMHVTTRIERRAHAEADTTIENTRFDFSWIDPADMRALIARSGFDIIDVFGDYDGRAFDGNSEEQVWFLRAK